MQFLWHNLTFVLPYILVQKLVGMVVGCLCLFISGVVGSFFVCVYVLAKLVCLFILSVADFIISCKFLFIYLFFKNYSVFMIVHANHGLITCVFSKQECTDSEDVFFFLIRRTVFKKKFFVEIVLQCVVASSIASVV